MPKILLVKTSSMGDVIHNLPVVSDILAHFPEAEIDWVVEESFAGIPALHPGVGKIIPVAVRRWRKHLLSRAVHTEISAFVKHLRSKTYDVVLDTQGLIKSAIITRLAQGARCGFDRQSAREPLAALFYDKTLRVEKIQHAVVRNRLLAGRALGYSPDDPVNYGIVAPSLALPWLPTTPFVVLLHATSRDDKLWPEAGWICLPLNVQKPQFRLGRLGGSADPARDFVRGSNHDLQAVHTGVTIADAEGFPAHAESVRVRRKIR